MKRFEDFIKKKMETIKAPEVFQISYTPDEIIERRETSLVYSEISNFIKYRTPLNLLILGLPGTGKTVTIKHIISKIASLELDIQTFYVSCRDKTSNQVLNILAGNGQKSHSDETLLKMFFTNKIKKDILLVLDEVDRGRRVRDILFHLSRPKEICDRMQHTVSIIMITNDLAWEESLNPATRSSLQLKKVYFNPYNETQLDHILNKRAQLGLRRNSVITKEDIRQIAKKTAKERRGDCRVALDTLFRIATLSETAGIQKIDDKTIEKMFNEAIWNIQEEMVMRLTNNQLAVLASCSGKKTLENIYETYKKVAKMMKVNIIGKTMMYYTLYYLEVQGLLERETYQTEGDELQKKTKIRLAITKEIVDDELMKRMYSIGGVNEKLK